MRTQPISPILLISAVFVCGLAGCADPSGETAEQSLPSLSQRLAESGGFKQDENGNWVPTNHKRSSFERQGESTYFKGSVEKPVYKTADYKTQSWWGRTSYEAGRYEGETDGSRFHRAADLRAKDTSYGQQRYATGNPYPTDQLAYDPASEASAVRIDKPGNDYTELQQRNFTQPAVIDWREQRKRSVEQSGGIPER